MLNRTLTTLFVTALVVSVAAPAAAQHAAETLLSADTPTPKTEGDRYPLGASIGLGFRTNHSLFVPTESEDFDPGNGVASLSVGIDYEITEKLSASLSTGLDKVVIEDQTTTGLGGGRSSNLTHPSAMRDINLSLGYQKFWTLWEIDFSSSLNGALPTSEASRSTGLITSFSPGLSAAWKYEDFSTSLSLSYYLNFHDDPSQQANCGSAAEFCKVAGRDLALPQDLMGVSSSLSFGYKIVSGLTASAAYSIGNSYSAVEFDNSDGRGAPGSQEGVQSGMGRHSTSFRLSYAITPHLSFAGAMSTGRSLYSNDNKEVTVPIFDTDSNLHHRTGYSFSLTSRI